MSTDPAEGARAQQAARRFESLFEAHYASVVAYALRRAEPGLAEDVAAETFLIAWRRLDVVPADALPWLYGVARRTLANHRRGVRRRRALISELSDSTSHVFASSEIADSLAERSGVVAALKRLPERDREVLRLVAWEGLDRTQAARAADCSPAAFAVRLHRARRRLLKELASGETLAIGMSPSAANPAGDA